MNCFTHSRTPAVGMCVVCQKGVCHECVARQSPRLVCRTCSTAAAPVGFGWSGWYGYGYELQVVDDDRWLAARPCVLRRRSGHDAFASGQRRCRDRKCCRRRSGDRRRGDWPADRGWRVNRPPDGHRRRRAGAGRVSRWIRARLRRHWRSRRGLHLRDRRRSRRTGGDRWHAMRRGGTGLCASMAEHAPAEL